MRKIETQMNAALANSKNWQSGNTLFTSTKKTTPLLFVFTVTKLLSWVMTSWDLMALANNYHQISSQCYHQWVLQWRHWWCFSKELSVVRSWQQRDQRIHQRLHLCLISLEGLYNCISTREISSFFSISLSQMRLNYCHCCSPRC